MRLDVKFFASLNLEWLMVIIVFSLAVYKGVLKELGLLLVPAYYEDLVWPSCGVAAAADVNDGATIFNLNGGFAQIFELMELLVIDFPLLFRSSAPQEKRVMKLDSIWVP